MEISVNFPISRLVAQLRQAQGTLDADRRALMRLLGIDVLSLSQQAYRLKARGQRGGDNIAWVKLKRSTLKARVLRRAPGRKIVEQRKAIARQIRQLLGTGRRRRRGQGARRRVRAARGGAVRRRRSSSPVRAIRRKLRSMPKIRGKGKTIREQVMKLRRKRMELLLKLEQLVDREVAKHEIGVDTGLQRASAAPGFWASDGKGGNTFAVTESKVTVGYNRKYSAAFDAKRPLMPEQLPGGWQQRIDGIAQSWANDIARRAFRGEA